MTEQTFLSSNFEDLIRSSVRPADPAPEALERILAEVNHNVKKDPLIKIPLPRRSLMWAAAGAVVVIATILVMLLTPQRVLAEIRRFFESFVPGYGFVQDAESLRMTRSPVRLERNGSWDTVELAYTDSKQTLILPGERHYVGPENKGCTAPAARVPYLVLHLPDGGEQRLEMVSRGQGYVFPPIPPDVSDVTFFLDWQYPCVDEPDWEFPLHFEPAPPGTTIPVVAVEEVAPLAPAAPQGDQISGQPSAPAEAMKPALTLEKVVETASGYIFGGRLTWQSDPERPVRYDLPMPDGLQMTDGAGRSFPLEFTNPGDLQLEQGEPQPNELRWAYQTGGKDAASPLTLNVPTLIKFVDDLSQGLYFDLDFGPAPQSGLAWGADRTYTLDGKTFRLTKVAYKLDPQIPNSWEVDYEFQVDPGVRSVFVAPGCASAQPSDPMAMGGGGGSSGTLEVTGGVLKGYTSLPAAPAGVCRFTITGIEYEDAIPWQIPIPLPGK